MIEMKRARYLIAASFAGAVLGIAVWQAAAQQAPNPFPLAAPAGRDSNARAVSPPGAVNQGPYNMSTWKYGSAFNAPAGTKIWNPAKIKLMQGGKVVGGTVTGVVDPNTYCAMANAGYDFTGPRCSIRLRVGRGRPRLADMPNAKAVPGVRIAYTDEQQIQHALDSGALVLVVPTVDTVEEAREMCTGPISRRWLAQLGGGVAFDPNCGAMFRRLSQHHQRQSGRHRHDRDLGRLKECR